MLNTYFTGDVFKSMCIDLCIYCMKKYITQNYQMTITKQMLFVEALRMPIVAWNKVQKFRITYQIMCLRYLILKSFKEHVEMCNNLWRFLSLFCKRLKMIFFNIKIENNLSVFVEYLIYKGLFDSMCIGLLIYCMKKKYITLNY